MTSFSTIILVPGAFQLASTVGPLRSQLEETGYNTTTFGLVTINQPKIKVQDDVAALASQVFQPLTEDQGKDTVLYLHSYAGFPIAPPAKEYPRPKGLQLENEGVSSV